MAEKRDYYEVLGIPKTATEAEIKKSFPYNRQEVSSTAQVIFITDPSLDLTMSGMRRLTWAVKEAAGRLKDSCPYGDEQDSSDPPGIGVESLCQARAGLGNISLYGSLRSRGYPHRRRSHRYSYHHGASFF